MRGKRILCYCIQKLRDFWSTLIFLIGTFLLFFVGLCMIDLLMNIGEFKVLLYPNLVCAAFDTVILYAIYNLVKPYEK